MKKIDTKKSTILGINVDDNDNLKLGTKGYFSHTLYSNFEPYREGELDGFTRSQYMTIERDPNGCSVEQWYHYFIPEDKVVFVKEKEKKLRPYGINEFFDKFTMLSRITFREKENKDCIITCIVNGYRTRPICIDVCLGVEWISLGTLFDKYEYKNTLGEWLPFGVEE